MQTIETLSCSTMPFRFCEDGEKGVDYAEIGASADGTSINYPEGLPAAFAESGGTFIGRKHVNSMGRLGTSAQAIMQAGGFLDIPDDIEFSEGAVIWAVNGEEVEVWVSKTDGNSPQPLGLSGGYYTVMGQTDPEMAFGGIYDYWASAMPALSGDFFDVS